VLAFEFAEQLSQVPREYSTLRRSRCLGRAIVHADEPAGIRMSAAVGISLRTQKSVQCVMR